MTIADCTAIMQPLGYCLSAMIYLFVQMIVLVLKSKHSYLLFAVVAVAFTALTFTAFRVGLQQMLARGIIEQLNGF